MKLLMIWTMVLIGAAFVMSSEASAIIVGEPPAASVGTTFIGSMLPSGVAPLRLAPRPPLGFTPGLGMARPPIFNPFLIRPAFNPFFNPFVDADDLGIGLGLGVNPGLVD